MIRLLIALIALTLAVAHPMPAIAITATITVLTGAAGVLIVVHSLRETGWRLLATPHPVLWSAYLENAA